MTTELTNCPTDGASASTGHLCATNTVEAVQDYAAAATAASESSANPHTNPDSWRIEVAARLDRYRTRRKPRTPRYPSLLLPFDAPESRSHSAPPVRSGSTGVATTLARAERDFDLRIEQGPAAVVTREFAEPCQTLHEALEEAPEPSAKVIEFPRSAAIPVFRPSDLADPVFDQDRPRIVEAPEILPPPPALGGILIEPIHREPAEGGADSFASPSASIVRRLLAAVVDGAVVAASVAAFAAIFLYFNPSLRLTLSLHPSIDQVRAALPIACALGLVAALLWAAYEFLFVVYTGSTPGLRAAGLRLAAFDGSPLNRRLCRWRVAASFLSAFSAGLGYLWCFLDQNGLCWHDRITRTHVQSATPAEKSR